MRNYYRDDPHWIRARFRSQCAQCGSTVNKGDELWYYPKSKRAYCQECGSGMSAAFEAEAADEYAYSH